MSADILRRASSQMRASVERNDLDSPHTMNCGYDQLEFASKCECHMPTVALATAQLLSAVASVLEAGNYTVESDAIPTWLHCEIDSLAHIYLGGAE